MATTQDPNKIVTTLNGVNYNYAGDPIDTKSSGVSGSWEAPAATSTTTTPTPTSTPPASSTITSSSLQPAPQIEPVQPTPVPVAPVNALDTSTPELTMTAPETEASALNKRLQELNNSLMGESAYQAEQDNVQGLPGLLKTQTELSSRVKALQNEALAIPLQLQQESIARGRTTAGLQPLQTSALRNNAIQALSASSLLEASKGNILLAQNLADRAVKQKFDPIREEIAAKTSNLNLILNSPEYSLADKNRAQKQLEILATKKAATDKQEENNKIAQAMATAAIKNNPGSSAALLAAQNVLNLNPSDPQYLQKVFQAVGQYQSDPAQIQKDLDAHLKSQSETAQNYAQASQIKANTAKINAETGLLNPGTNIKLPTGNNVDSGAISTAIAGLKFSSVADRKDAQSTITRLLASGDLAGAKEQLQTYARNSASAAQIDTLDGKANALSALVSIQDGLTQLKSKGINTNIFTGLSENALQKIGSTTGDATAQLKASIALAIIDYRHAVSGAAFTTSEAAEYNRLFPSIGKTSQLNTSNIAALIEKFQTDTDNFYRSKIGPAKYDSIFGSGSKSNSQGTSGVIRMTGPAGTFEVKPEDVAVFKANGYK